jgi:beta-aspartyl-peptidase (threonine type)
LSTSPDLRIDSGVVIHGGVGTLSPEDLTPDLEAAYRETLDASLRAGHDSLSSGGSAMDAVCAAVRVLEDSPLFNAGRGSNFDERGVVTMDASVMDGQTLDAGAVAGVTSVRNPVDLARLLMERSEHLMLTGAGAEAFARTVGLEDTDPAFFHTERRWEDLLREREAAGGRPNVLGPVDPTSRAGTVGAVARDPDGRLAAATSTGGMANKTWGRVGDSPIIGAGTYASELCAVSCTGWGEYFIRHAAAHDVHARMAHGGASLKQATHGVIWETLHAHVPSSGGLVAVDGQGHVELCFNTPGMYRGWVDQEGRRSVSIYPD